MFKKWKSRRKYQVELLIPPAGNSYLSVISPDGREQQVHFEWFEADIAERFAQLVADGFGAKLVIRPKT
jgi:hypothetical protein